jgi:hypothetical protein
MSSCSPIKQPYMKALTFKRVQLENVQRKDKQGKTAIYCHPKKRYIV